MKDHPQVVNVYNQKLVPIVQTKPVVDKQKWNEEQADLSRRFAANNFLRKGEGIGAG